MFKLVILISLLMALLSSPSHAYTVFSDEDTLDTVTETMPLCKERPCSRIYRPMCISVDGKPKTLPSRCHFNNLRCNAMERTRNSNDAPVFRVMHAGPC
ncbi:uncharacterized protein LOC105262560 [Musca domestica]|uniref:Uncharacterized protein LOC105262560 n=1 Tax=Musca domestica TaxID=7370 RepID=A0A9J7ICD9_MUSDO|nr:uncharacterized protein LOC105262560 [Musca domestica]